MIDKKNSGWVDYSLLIVFLSALFFTCLGSRPFAAPDEGRYVEIPREMVASGSYITPHLNGLKYFEKPPLVYWLEAVPLKLGLTSEFFLRLPIALFALLGCLGVYAYASRIYSRQAGYFSAIVLATTVLYFSLARLILLDLVLTVLLSLGLFSFILGVKLPAGKERPLKFALASTFFAGAVLTKGLIGLVLPIGIIGLWVITLNKWKDVRPLYLPTNLFVFLILVLPWHILVSLDNPQFFDFYFIREHFERYLTTIHRRMQPFWFFMPVFVLGFFPWIVFLPRALKNFIPFKFKDWKIYDLEAFLLLWAGFIFLFFSFSSSNLIPYILPIFPPLAVIVGRFLAYVTEGEQSTKIEAIIYFMISLLLTIGIPWGVEKYADPDLCSNLSSYIPFVQFYLMGSSLSFLLLSLLKKTRWKLWGLLGFHIGFLFTLNAAAPLIQKTSMKPFATHIKTNLPASTEVVFYGMYAQDLPFYLGKTVKILNWSGELDFGKSLDPQNSIFLAPKDFKALGSTLSSLCVIAKENAVPEIPFPSRSHFKVVFQQDEFVLLCKK
ncbi:MAG: hypothetical protein A2977_03090 [Alphaproteobacteria bacterium RIFCSPLOWO2_01_FULL_45_8]|nr:MAG: hypothetical protein A2977_03090 [Alphaproteobacteria bacterium RIFCSPLOWO2_01_FULL_45_8]